MECDGQALAQMTLENGDTMHAECAASNLKRLDLSVAQLVGKGTEVKFSPSGAILTSRAGKGGQGEEDGVTVLLAGRVGCAAEHEEALRRAMAPFAQDEEL